MIIRPFRAEDAEFCFKIRSSAFIRVFYGELSPEAVAAGVNAYMPGDYIRMAEKSPFFIAEDSENRIGFFTIARADEVTAEIPLIYFDLDCVGKGLGRKCVRFIENWIQEHWKGNCF